MKTQHDTIESLLEKAKDTGFSARERDDMWRTLEEYATFHPAKKQTPKPLFTHMSGWLAAAAAMFILTVGTGTIATNSLPGESMYALKVSMVEPIIGYTKFTETEQLNYQEHLLERRLDEMQALANTERLTEQATTELETQVAEHSNEIQELLADDTDESIAAETKLDVLTKAVVTLRTHAFIEDTELSTQRSSKFTQTEKTISALYASEVETFATTQPQDAAAYIEDTLHEIHEQTDDIASTSPSFIEIKDYLLDVESALASGTLDRALQYTGEAQQSIELQENLAEIK